MNSYMLKICHIPTLHHHDIFPPGGNVLASHHHNHHYDDHHLHKSRYERLGLLLLGCCPGGVGSNFWTAMLGGENDSHAWR